MLLAFDVGNSGIKVGAFDGESLVATARLPDPRSDLGAALGRSVAGAVLVAISVNEDALAALLAGAGKGAIVLGRDLPIRMVNRYRDPSETGPDRLAAAAAAHAVAGGAAVVVDVGSAVTVDAVDDDGVFLGGTIGPGRSALVAGLRGAAPALPCAGELPEGEEPVGLLPVLADDLLDGGDGLSVLRLGLLELGQSLPGRVVLLLQRRHYVPFPYCRRSARVAFLAEMSLTFEPRQV